MPRIEIIPENWETSEEKKQGNGSPTIDLCRSCARQIEEGDNVDDAFPAGMPEYDGGTIGSTSVVHPDYEEGDYNCDCCDASLTNEDN